jgi:hypothetical protein
MEGEHGASTRAASVARDATKREGEHLAAPALFGDEPGRT